jgi:hypothetical protein
MFMFGECAILDSLNFAHLKTSFLLVSNLRKSVKGLFDRFDRPSRHVVVLICFYNLLLMSENKNYTPAVAYPLHRPLVLKQ